MNKIYNYVFWFNHHTDLWYAIPREEYINFFNGHREYQGVLKSNKIETLIYLIEHPTSII